MERTAVSRQPSAVGLKALKISGLKADGRWPMAGFTLIEMLIAFVIFLISVIGMSSFYYANRRILVTAKDHRSGMWSAISKMEELKGTAYDDLSDGSDGNISWTVTEPEPGVLYKQITITVTGTNPVTLSTYVANTS